MKKRTTPVSVPEGIYPLPVYSTAELNQPALENPPDGHVAFVSDRYRRVAHVVWSALIGSYVYPDCLPYIAVMAQRALTKSAA